MKHITERLQKHLNLKCSFEDFVAVNDNVMWLTDHQRRV